MSLEALRPHSVSPAEALVEKTAKPESVNWYVTSICNYKCDFCFFTDRGFRASLDKPSPLHLTKEQSMKILTMLFEAGTKKITFAGGEPTTYHLLPELIERAKRLGMTTMLVTNGTGLTDSFLDSVTGYLDAVKFSIDSPSNHTEYRMGRGYGHHVDEALMAAERVEKKGMIIMLNTVVSRLNLDEDMTPIVRKLRPVRWKVFQILPAMDMNAANWDKLKITGEEFQSFIERHSKLMPIVEDNETMADSYVIIDPIGRFMQDSGKRHVYSTPILEVGVMPALAQVGWNYLMFLKRGGRYELPEHRK